jgi:hypothetical protein
MRMRDIFGDEKRELKFFTIHFLAWSLMFSR